MEVFNLATGELGRDHGDIDGWRARSQRIGNRLGAEDIGGTVYELEDGQRVWPYHYHHGVEEWLLVIDGDAILRGPDGERVMRPGDVVCFPSGPMPARTRCAAPADSCSSPRRSRRRSASIRTATRSAPGRRPATIAWTSVAQTPSATGTASE